MSTTPNVSLEERVAILQAELDKKKSSSFDTKLKKIWLGIVAAFASTDAVRQEKSLAATVITRLLINSGATGGLVIAVLKAKGWIS